LHQTGFPAAGQLQLTGETDKIKRTYSNGLQCIKHSGKAPTTVKGNFISSPFQEVVNHILKIKDPGHPASGIPE
jgi:hypothetical protein